MTDPNEQGQWPEQDHASSHPTQQGGEPSERPDGAAALPMTSSSQPVQPSPMELPPSYSHDEELPLADPSLESLPDSMFLPYVPSARLSFAEHADDKINAALNRTPVGTSVVDPDSVLGESGRLYHGYKEGKYFLPNDAVSCHIPCSIRPLYLKFTSRQSKTDSIFSMSFGACK